MIVSCYSWAISHLRSLCVNSFMWVEVVSHMEILSPFASCHKAHFSCKVTVKVLSACSMLCACVWTATRAAVALPVHLWALSWNTACALSGSCVLFQCPYYIRSVFCNLCEATLSSDHLNSWHPAILELSHLLADYCLTVTAQPCQVPCNS